MVVWYQGKRAFRKRGSRQQLSKGQGPKKAIGFFSKKTSLRPSESCSIFLLTFYFELMIDSQFIVWYREVPCTHCPASLKGCILTVTTWKQGNWDWHTTINSTADLNRITVRPALIKQWGQKSIQSGWGREWKEEMGRIDSKHLLYSSLCQAQQQTGHRRGLLK